MSSAEAAPLAGLSPAERARCALAAHPSLVWAAGGDAGTAPCYDECGSPMLVADDEVAHRLLSAGSGRVELDLHPALGLVRLAGQFWPVVSSDAWATLDAIRDDHAHCPRCPSREVSQVIGLQVVTASIRLPGERDGRAVGLDEYLLAEPSPVVAVGARMAAHLNGEHAAENRALGARLLQVPIDQVVGARVGAVDELGFELAVIDRTGGHRVLVRFPRPPRTEGELLESFRSVVHGVSGHRGRPAGN